MKKQKKVRGTKVPADWQEQLRRMQDAEDPRLVRRGLTARARRPSFTCVTCRYFKQERSPEETRAYNANYPMRARRVRDGECRLTSPAMVPIEDDVFSLWPEVNGDDWCGEYAFDDGRSIEVQRG